MTEAAKKYDDLYKKLMAARKKGELTEDQDDDLLDEMSRLWWLMDPEECDARDLAQG